jgi:hypothetical protein
MAAVMVHGLVEEGLDARLGVAPGSCIERLFLAPNDILGVRVPVKVVLKLLPWERMQLLDADDGGVLDALGLAVFYQSGVHLAGTKDDAFDALGVIDGDAVLGFGDDPVEVRVTGELLERRPANRVTEKRFREEENQGLREGVSIASAHNLE